MRFHGTVEYSPKRVFSKNPVPLAVGLRHLIIAPAVKLVASNRLGFELFACSMNETHGSGYEWLRASTVPTALQLACYCKRRRQARAAQRTRQDYRVEPRGRLRLFATVAVSP